MSTIFLVEDDEAIRSIVEFILVDTLIGCTVHAAATGVEFLKLLTTRTPDLILLDVRLPDANGVSLYQMLRQNEHLARVPVLFVTANPDLVHQAFLNGPHACLAKPFCVDALIEQVQTLLGVPIRPRALTA